MRDTAILLLGFAGARRRSELAALTLVDLEAKPGGLLLHLRRSKTDTEGRGQVVDTAAGRLQAQARHRDQDLGVGLTELHSTTTTAGICRSRPIQDDEPSLPALADCGCTPAPDARCARRSTRWQSRTRTISTAPCSPC